MKEATQFLEEEVIPKYAAFLDRYYTENSLSQTFLREEFPKLITNIHRKVYNTIRLY